MPRGLGRSVYGFSVIEGRQKFTRLLSHLGRWFRALALLGLITSLLPGNPMNLHPFESMCSYGVVSAIDPFNICITQSVDQFVARHTPAITNSWTDVKMTTDTDALDLITYSLDIRRWRPVLDVAFQIENIVHVIRKHGDELYWAEVFKSHPNKRTNHIIQFSALVHDQHKYLVTDFQSFPSRLKIAFSRAVDHITHIAGFIRHNTHSYCDLTYIQNRYLSILDAILKELDKKIKSLPNGPAPILNPGLATYWNNNETAWDVVCTQRKRAWHGIIIAKHLLNDYRQELEDIWTILHTCGSKHQKINHELHVRTLETMAKVINEKSNLVDKAFLEHIQSHNVLLMEILGPSVFKN